MAVGYSGTSLGTTRANAAVAMFHQGLGRAVWGVAAAGIMILACCARPALGKEVKGLSFYPPFQSFNARGMTWCKLPGVSALVLSVRFLPAGLPAESVVAIVPKSLQKLCDAPLFGTFSGCLSDTQLFPHCAVHTLAGV